MKVQELRELLKIADRPLLEKAFVESYKQFSKHQKEDIDVMISDILSGKDLKKIKQESTANFDQLEQEIKIFLTNAYEQNYFAPNRIIPKNQRPKWRFLVKNYIKELQKIPPEDKNHKRAVNLMADLYAMLCEACCYYLFATEDPFRSIGWEQPDLFSVLVKMSVKDGLTQEHIASLIKLAAGRGVSIEAMNIEQETILIDELRTDTAKRMAVDISQELVEEKISMLAKLQKNENSRYNIEEMINELCGMILILMNLLGETETGIAYYFKNSQASTKTAELYDALRIADFIDDDLLWIKIYEYALKKRIKPTKSTQEEYEKKKNCGDITVQTN